MEKITQSARVEIDLQTTRWAIVYITLIEETDALRQTYLRKKKKKKSTKNQFPEIPTFNDSDVNKKKGRGKGGRGEPSRLVFVPDGTSQK